MNATVQARSVGRLFTAGALAAAELKAAPAIARASETLANEIRSVAPRATGNLASKIKPVGFGFARRVQADVPYAVPLDKGTAPGYVPIEPVALWASIKLGLAQGEARRMAFALSRSRSTDAHRGARFFFKTFDRIAARIQRDYLDAIGIKVAEDLDR